MAAKKVKAKAAVAKSKPDKPAEKKAKLETKDEDEKAEDPDEDEDESSGEGEDEEGAEEDEVEEKAAGPKPRTKADRLKKMMDKDEEEEKEPRGVVYLGHLPKGFYEPQMKTFFSQFGTITRIRLSRSKHNAASKGYAFIEFEEESVAKIVADTMHKYLLFEKQLVAELIPKERQHASLFKGWKGGLKNMSGQRRRKAVATYNDRPKVDDNGELVPQVTGRQIMRRSIQEKKLAEFLKEHEIDFDVKAASAGHEKRYARLPHRKRKKAKKEVKGTKKKDTGAKSGKEVDKTGAKAAAKVEEAKPAAVASKPAEAAETSAPRKKKAKKGSA